MMMQNVDGWHHVSVDSLAAGDRLARWNEVANSLFPDTGVRGDARDEFNGRISWIEIGRLMLAEFMSTSMEVARETEHIHRQDHWYEVNLQIEGHYIFNQGGREVSAGPRSIILYDSQQPYRMNFPGEYRQLALKVPRDMLRDRVPCLDSLIAREVDGNGLPGKLLFDFIVSLCEFSASPKLPALKSRLETHVVDLLATALMDVADDQNLSAVRQSQLVRIKSYILANLDNPDLGPSEVAREQNISLRSLYELFEGETTQVAQWIKVQRLERIRRDLVDPLMQSLPITSIALRWGFKDFSHFSRAFRARYGIPPRDFRRQYIRN